MLKRIWGIKLDKSEKKYRITDKVTIHSYQKKLLIYILIPVGLTLVFYTLINVYLLNNVKNQLLYQNELNHKNLVYNYEKEFYSMQQSSLLLMQNDTFKDLYYSYSPLQPEEYYVFANTRDILSAFSSTKSYILQSGFISHVNNRYISSECTSYKEDYFDNSYFGSVVNQSGYIDNYEKRNGIYQIQPLDTKYNQTIIPILQFQIGEYFLSSPLILYISKNYFSSNLSYYKLTPGSDFFIYCEPTGQIIASTNVSMEEELLQQIVEGKFLTTGLHSITAVNRKYFCFVSYSNTNYSDPLLYISLVPYSDIQTQTNIALKTSIISFCVCCILSSALCYLLSFKLYLPIRNILNTIKASITRKNSGNSGEKIPGDELFLLGRHIKELLHTNEDLQMNITNALPLLYTQYITNILYQREYCNKNLEPLIADYAFHFPYPYFTCSILVPKLMPDFYNDFTNKEQTLIMQQLNDVLVLTQDNSYLKYIFHIEQNCYCIITNSPESDQKDTLTTDFTLLQELFSFDKHYIKLYIACGKSCESIQQIHESWKQANNALSHLSTFGNDTICFYEDESCYQNNYIVNAEDNNLLSTFLLQGNIEAATDLVSKIIRINQDSSLTGSAIKDLYIHLYELGDQVIRREKLSALELLGEHYASLSSFINNYSNLERSEYIYHFYNTLCQRHIEDSTSSFNLQDMKNYIDQHYQENIYLENLAEVFHTSPKYMSRLLKNALGMPFKQYLTILRISNAKDLLIKTDIKIEDISIASGFNSRNSFIRTFKQSENITPSEFRCKNRQA